MYLLTFVHLLLNFVFLKLCFPFPWLLC
jgi:hypothetical protein